MVVVVVVVVVVVICPLCYRCTALSSLGIYVYTELCRGVVNTKLYEAVNVILSSLQVSLATHLETVFSCFFFYRRFVFFSNLIVTNVFENIFVPFLCFLTPFILSQFF